MKIITSRGNYCHQVSLGSDKNCGFFTNGQFLSVSVFFLLSPYFERNMYGFELLVSKIYSEIEILDSKSLIAKIKMLFETLLNYGNKIN